MMKKHWKGKNLGSRKSEAVLRVLLVLGWGLAAGCESSTTSEHAIVVTPPSTTLAGGRGTVLLTAAPANTNAVPRLFLPLEWSVSEPPLGRIESAAGTSAVYVGLGGRGANAITVRDQSKAEGVAVVYHGETE
jgi:hypothetical protein